MVWLAATVGCSLEADSGTVSCNASKGGRESWVWVVTEMVEYAVDSEATEYLFSWQRCNEGEQFLGVWSWGEVLLPGPGVGFLHRVGDFREFVCRDGEFICRMEAF